MRKSWSEAIIALAMCLLALAITLLAIKFGQSGTSTPKPEIKQTKEERTPAPHTDTSDGTRELESKNVEEVRPQTPRTTTTQRPPVTGEPNHLLTTSLIPTCDRVQDSLRAGLLYIANGSFDRSKHTTILSNLVLAYAVKGLSAETNAALRSAIQQVNELGIAQVELETRSMAPDEAKAHLLRFLKETPRLSTGQQKKIGDLIEKSASRGAS